MFIIIGLLALPVVIGKFFGQWEPRIANWNTGRLYFGDNFGPSFGPVCQGNGAESITGKNGKRFGSLVCKEIGFGKLEFIGLHAAYVSHMDGKTGYNATLYNESKLCIPSYRVSGATCKEGTNLLSSVRNG